MLRAMIVSPGTGTVSRRVWEREVTEDVSIGMCWAWLVPME